jgi:hypothetical protein
MRVLEKNNMTTPALMQVLGRKSNLRKQPKGYSGIDGARKLLNDMIFESMSKYDAEIAKCTEFYAQQCDAMEACRSKISAANYVAANSRALILDSQATINKCEVDIPTMKYQLKQHNLKCKHEIYKMNTRLKIVMGDIAVMTMILKMTDCEKKIHPDEGILFAPLSGPVHAKELHRVQPQGLAVGGQETAVIGLAGTHAQHLGRPFRWH